ncbi:serine hydrolase domain-containing protein [Chitinophaga sp.]|uniref:serine hydrolase domain-containing protein n=1 Tax=Chitinophaga sp. TaxID=1869181 RepID=UPI0031D9904C
MKTLFKCWLLALAVAITASSCVKDKAPMPTKVFNVAKFKALLKDGIMKAKATLPRGFSFVINQNGQWVDTCSYGYGYIKGDRVSPMRPDLEVNIASVTKPLTAIAVLQLLQKQNVHLDSSIGKYLPVYFKATAEVKNITFRQLLAHKSGITSGSHEYVVMKDIVKQPLAKPSKGYAYANMNYALFRVIIPYLINRTAALQIEASLVPDDTASFELFMAKQYIKYMQENVFTPIGLNEVLCKPGPVTAHYFNEGPKLSYVDFGDWTEDCAGGGIHLSTMEMARVMAYLVYTEKLLSNAQKKLMDDELLGWDQDDSWMTIAGPSYGKGGLLYWDDRGMQTLVVKYPSKVELALTVNSWDGSRRELSLIANNAYNDSWE